MTKTARQSPDDAPRWEGYSDAERAAIQSAWPDATDEDVNALVGRVEAMVSIPELDINDLAKASRVGLAGMEHELCALDTTIDALKDRVQSIVDEDEQEPIHRAAAAALAPLILYRVQLNLERDRLGAFGADLAANMRPTAKKLFRSMLFDLIERAWRRDGERGPTFEKDYRAFWEAVVLPPFNSSWVRRRVGDALSTGTFKAHIEAIRNRENSSRANSE